MVHWRMDRQAAPEDGLMVSLGLCFPGGSGKEANQGLIQWCKSGGESGRCLSEMDGVNRP